MNWRIVCKHCDGTPEAHHDFEPKMPPGCVCQPVEWLSLIDGSIKMPCERFVPSADETCARCEHDKGCHT